MNKKPKIPSPELLLDYLDGILDLENTHRIRKEIEESEELKSIVDGIVHLKELEEYDNEQILEYIQKLQSGFKEEKTISKLIPNTKFIWLKIAASLLLVVTAWFVLQNIFSTTTMSDFVDVQLSEIYPAPELFRDKNSDWTLVHKYYNEGEYNFAATELSKIKTSDPDDKAADFYLGLCYLYDNKTDRAIEYLQSVSTSTSRLSNNAKWFLSLAYLKTRNEPMAKSILTAVIDAKSYKHEEAQKLIELFD